MSVIITAIIAHLDNELTTASAASEQAHASATHSENVADNKYDTLAVEAAYLAHGQSLRIAQLQQSIATYRLLMQTQKPDTESIQIGHTVTIVDTNQRSNTLYIGPSAGGISIVIDGTAMMTVTALTPIGKALIGKVVDEEISIVVGGNQQHFVITDIK